MVKKTVEKWELKAWFLGNWTTIKELAKVGAPLALGWAATAHPAWTAVITVLGKMLLDTGEFYYKRWK